LPWCVCMGATFPWMMAYVRERDSQNAESFSFLYVANVLGAMTGTLLAAVVLLELMGFHYTLWVAATGNFIIAVIGGYLGWQQRSSETGPLTEAERPARPGNPFPPRNSHRPVLKWILFSTGFGAMGMEVVWTRAFTPVLKTQVYSFALIVFTYLCATFLGSLAYRRDLKKRSPRPTAKLISFLTVAALLPILANDPRFIKANWMYVINIVSAIIVLISICPLCAVLGYLTPSLIDEYAAGDPAVAGRAYAVNVLGCILGPLFASYVLLPWISERYALILLSLPFFVFYFLGWRFLSWWLRWGSGLAASALLVCALFFSEDFQAWITGLSQKAEVRRDYAAYTIAADDGRTKLLMVNGIGMTALTPITKFMVHLPLAFHKGPPESALVICFGMGTTYRSALSWNIDTTVVELVPGVPKLFGFYHADAERVLHNPHGHIVIDDGRRFLNRTREKFDVIVVDPPPPMEAAGSSLLYSREFYELAKQHLKPRGILQAWLPGGEFLTAQAVLCSAYESFPYVRCFNAVEGDGIHILASMEPIERLDAQQLAARMPPGAKTDLLEWSHTANLAGYLGLVVSREKHIEKNLIFDPEIQITDDNPFNEYFLLRHWHLL